MNFSINDWPPFMLFIPIIAWLVSLYLILRFLRAFERGVDAHERIANTLAKSSRAPSTSRFDEGAT
ncbi:MAG TPA: hypothetical protein VK636_08430 [Gemmatimonadaceae bacterium]|nr:hypothetical protein [Gemmatimonadaceae bacterium]